MGSYTWKITFRKLHLGKYIKIFRILNFSNNYQIIRIWKMIFSRTVVQESYWRSKVRDKKKTYRGSYQSIWGDLSYVQVCLFFFYNFKLRLHANEFIFVQKKTTPTRNTYSSSQNTDLTSNVERTMYETHL